MNTAIVVVLCSVSLLTAAIIISKTVKELQKRSRDYAQRRTILDHGVSAQAVIHAVQPTNVTVGDQPQVVLDLSIDSPDGKTVRTQLKTVIPIVHIPSFQPGKTIEVKQLKVGRETIYEVVGAYIP